MKAIIRVSVFTVVKSLLNHTVCTASLILIRSSRGIEGQGSQYVTGKVDAVILISYLSISPAFATVQPLFEQFKPAIPLLP